MYKNNNYRPDIDGLRGLSVILVLLFHYYPETFPGGFIGVDIFFVISGYFISKKLLNIKNLNINDLLNFYQNRILRIFPSLIITYLICLVLGWFILMPQEYELLGSHVFYSTLFIPNIIFMNESDYFNASNKIKPLLNLWSLGVEEQFYIFWPILIILITKISTKSENLKRYILAIILVVSFIVYCYYIYYDTTKAFYLPFSRFWEFMCGALLIHLKQTKTVANPSNN